MYTVYIYIYGNHIHHIDIIYACFLESVTTVTYQWGFHYIDYFYLRWDIQEHQPRFHQTKPARFPVPARAFRGWKPPCLLHRCSGSESAAWLLGEQDLVIFVLRKVESEQKMTFSKSVTLRMSTKTQDFSKKYSIFLNWFNLPRIFVPGLKLTQLPCTTQLSRVQIDASVFNWFNVLHVPHGCTWWLAKALDIWRCRKGIFNKVEMILFLAQKSGG